ncbi:MAG: archaemetzincin family Zn-dependent metalloprotease [Candidatus Zixiibacteriota bacterium]
MDAEIHVVGVGLSDTTLMDRLAADLTATISHTAVVARWTIDPKGAYDPLRNQYNSSYILSELFRRQIPGKSRLLGVTDVDLYAPVLTFVFGEAQLGGPTAVVSTHRMRPELYGLDPDPELLFRRLLVEAVHELGHTAGLRHCLVQRCAMNGSTYVEEIDLKGPGFCSACQAVFDQSFH